MANARGCHPGSVVEDEPMDIYSSLFTTSPRRRRHVHPARGRCPTPHRGIVQGKRGQPGHDSPQGAINHGQTLHIRAGRPCSRRKRYDYIRTNTINPGTPRECGPPQIVYAVTPEVGIESGGARRRRDKAVIKGDLDGGRVGGGGGPGGGQRHRSRAEHGIVVLFDWIHFGSFYRFV